jgi:DNA-directed RNA polymerase subunit RPC12/RpoP
MKEISRRTVMAEVAPEDMTEGQMADYEASELGGDFSDWSMHEVTYECTKCGHRITVQHS